MKKPRLLCSRGKRTFIVRDTNLEHSRTCAATARSRFLSIAAANTATAISRIRDQYRAASFLCDAHQDCTAPSTPQENRLGCTDTRLSGFHQDRHTRAGRVAASEYLPKPVDPDTAASLRHAPTTHQERNLPYRERKSTDLGEFLLPSIETQTAQTCCVRVVAVQFPRCADPATSRAKS